MPGMYKYSMEIESNVKKLLLDTKELQDRMDTLEGKEYKINLNIDEKKLGNVISNLEKMLDSLGKGTGDFKQFETLSKDLAKVTSELSGFTKAFGKIDDLGTKSLFNMVQNIDKSLSNLSSHVTDVVKNLGNIGKDSGASSAVAQIENMTKANEEAIKSTEKLAEARKKINDNVSVSTKGTSFTSNTSALQQEEKQIQKNINSLNKLLALKSDVKNVKKSSYSGKGNLDYVGIYHSQEEAVSKDLATKSNKLNASLNLILNEDKDAVQELESEVTKLKTSLQSVQDLTKRISKNSSINDLTKEQDVTERLKGYASAYQAIDTRLGELNNEYSLSNKQLEEYITLQAKAEKIMNEVASNEFGGVRGYGDVTSKAQLKMLVEESFAKRLGYDSQDVYDGLFKNISDANYESKHISLFGDNGKKRSLKEVSAQILDYKSSASSLSGVFGANEDIERLNTLNSILNYIKTNEKEIANTDFTAQINRLTAMLENTSGLTFLEEELQELKSYQERLDSVKNTSIDSASTSSSISEQNKVQEELKETQTQAKKTKEALNESNISSEVSAFQQQEKIQNQATQSIQEQNKAIDESIKKTLTLNDVRQKQWEIIQKTNPKEEGTNSTWVDKPEDAKTFYEVNHKDSDYPFNENYSDDWTVKDKMNVEATGKITVYSSYPIEDGNWVTPSKEEGLSYAGSGKLYSATMDPRDIAWVDAGQGQVAHISDELKEVIDLSTKAETQVQSIDNKTNETGEQSTLNALDDTIAKYETIVSLVKEYYDLSNNKKDTIGISSDDERISEIRKQLKSYTKNPDYNGEYKMGFGGSGKNIFAKSVDLSQEEMLQEICNMLGVEIPKNADKAKEAIKEVASAATTEQKKDAFPSTDTKPEAESMEQIEEATHDAVQAKKDFATANEGVQSSIDGSKSPLQLEAELMDQIAKSAREAADAKKEFVEANKQVKDSANKSNNDLVGGHSENAEPSGVKKYKKKDYKAHDTGNHDNEKKVSNKAELGKALKDLQSEIIASIDESTSFVKEVTDFYDSQDNLVKTQMKIGDKNGSMRTYTTSYSMDKDGNATAWTSHIETQKIAEQAKQEASNIQAEWDKNIKAIQDYMDAMTKLNNLKAKDKGTGNQANQIALQIQNVEELKQVAFEARQNLSSMQAENPDIIAWKQWVDMMELFDQASKGSAESAAKLKDVLDNIKAPSLDKYENKLSSYLNKTGGYNATIARFNDGGWTSNAYLENVQAVKNAVKEYEDLLNELKGKDANLVTSEDINKLDSYEKKIKDTIATVTNMSAAEKGYNFVSGQKELDKIHKLLNENSKMSSEAKAKIKAYYAEIESGNPSMSLDRIHGEIMKIYNAEVEAGRAGKSLIDVFKTSRLHQMVAQVAGMFSVYDVINVIKQAASTVTELNTQITELAKVSEQSSKQIYADFDSYADIAKEVRGTISDTIAATADWSKNGYSIPDAKQLAEISQLYKNVGDGIDIDTANESLISTLKGFQLEADQAEHIVDVFNEVSNNEAISSGGIGEALQRSAASFNAANTSLEQSVALVTATNSVLQDPEKVGNMWKTVSARIRGKLVPIYSENYSLCA